MVSPAFDLGRSSAAAADSVSMGADGLAALVRETLRLDPFPGMVFVFRAKPANHVDESVRNKTE